MADLPPSFQTVVGVQTAMTRQGLFETPPVCPGADIPPLRAFAANLNNRLGQRAGALTSVTAFDPNARRIEITSRAIGGTAATKTAWTLRFEGASAGGEPDAEGFCVESIEITDLNE